MCATYFFCLPFLPLSSVETNADELELVVVDAKAPIRLVITQKLDNEILSRSSDAHTAGATCLQL